MQRLTKEEFPELLMHIPNPPKELWCEGVLPSKENKLLTVVGSRACTPYGREACRSLLRGLQGYPITIVSGLALGIDACAHRCALDFGLHTVAVPGSGLDPSVWYPRSNVNLAKEILAAGGCLLSEFEPTQPAATWTFPQRNRIMAGMSHATLLIEASEKSGTLITARLASDYNREVLVVPGSIFSKNSDGTHQFLRLGATPVTDSKHILEALGIAVDDAREAQELPENEAVLMEALIEPLTRDSLAQSINLAPDEIAVSLSMLELKGLISEREGVIYRA